MTQLHGIQSIVRTSVSNRREFNYSCPCCRCVKPRTLLPLSLSSINWYRRKLWKLNKHVHATHWPRAWGLAASAGVSDKSYRIRDLRRHNRDLWAFVHGAGGTLVLTLHSVAPVFLWDDLRAALASPVPFGMYNYKISNFVRVLSIDYFWVYKQAGQFHLFYCP